MQPSFGAGDPEPATPVLTSPSAATLRHLYAQESARIQQDFAANGDGRQAIAARAALLDSILARLWKEMFQAEGESDVALVACGGYGRQWLFPSSDIDLLFLHPDPASEQAHKNRVRQFCQELWDLRLKVSPAHRVLAECERFDPGNIEFFISLLDCRYLAGKHELFTRLREKVVPRLVMRESQALVQNLAEVTRLRQRKYDHTIFHLEPNVKDGPGGLRDYNVAYWLALISSMEKLREWPDANTLLPVSVRRQFDPALAFLMSVRCFLHYRQGRDDNVLSWQAQDEAAARKIGAPDADALNAAHWMRIYFGHARAVHRFSTKLQEEIPAAWSSLHRQFQTWRSRISDPDFSVVDSLVFLQRHDSLHSPETLLRLFHFVAQHGVKLSTTTEHKLEQVLPSMAAAPPRGAELWLYLSEMLVQPHAADALRAMHSLRLLTLLLPELMGIDALVIRDYYHRFTVDEHSFVAIENLHRLAQAQSGWEKQYSGLLEELEQPELLYLSLLLHDTGKSLPGEHVQGSLEFSRSCVERLDLEPSEREIVLFLVGGHLEMSAALRRDIFDSGTVRNFAGKVGTPERLKMLTLMTYADVKAVNPEALTPWKAENIWQLYIATANYLDRSADERVHVQQGEKNVAHLQSLSPQTGRAIQPFLEGLSQRYLRIHSAAEVLAHADMAARLGKDGIQLNLKRGRHWYELAIVTTDRPSLFASISGVLAAWGMNIVKADAFSNSAGVVVDTFYFTDRFRTLELNLPEWDRFKASISSVLKGEAGLERMLRDRTRSRENTVPKIAVATRVEFDNTCSAHSTLVQVIAQDQPGLLYRISSQFARFNHNIEIALIDTEGQMAIDVFYLTFGKAKLTREQQHQLRDALIEALKPAPLDVPAPAGPTPA